jgi:hypothetical protein
MAEPATNAEPQNERSQQATPSGEDRIRIRAYELYEKRNGAPGDAESDWYRAEAELESDSEK